MKTRRGAGTNTAWWLGGGLLVLGGGYLLTRPKALPPSSATDATSPTVNPAGQASAAAPPTGAGPPTGAAPAPATTIPTLSPMLSGAIQTLLDPRVQADPSIYDDVAAAAAGPSGAQNSAIVQLRAKQAADQSARAAAQAMQTQAAQAAQSAPAFGSLGNAAYSAILDPSATLPAHLLLNLAQIVGGPDGTQNQTLATSLRAKAATSA